MVSFLHMKYTEAQLAYLAGLLDGEGCFHICDKRKSPKKALGLRKPRKEYVGQVNFTTQVAICNTHLGVLQWLKDTFGGGVHIAKTRYKPNWDFKKQWIMPCKVSKELIEAILPYLIIKVNQAKLMIEARKIIDANVLRMERTVEQRDHLFFLATNMKLFNKKDPSALLSPLTQQGDPSQLPQVYPRQVC